MLYLVKIEPNLFFLALAPVKPGVIKVSLEAPVGCSSIENKRASGDGAGEPRWACIGGGGGGWNFQGIGGGNRCLWENFTHGGGNVGGHRTLGHDFMAVAGHD